MTHWLRILALSLPWLFGPLALSQQALAQQQGPLPDGPGANLVYAKCQQCHPIDYVTDSAGLPDFLWKDTLDLMKQLGMQVTDEEEEKLYQYFITYLGTRPPPEPAADAETADVDGAAIYAGTCAVCHGAEGQGTPGSFPPIAGHAAKLANADRAYLPLVVIHGLSGEIEIAGHQYNGVMPGWGQLSNEEIAAALNVVTGWDPDNQVEPYTASEIQEAREIELTGPGVQGRRPEIAE